MKLKLDSIIKCMHIERSLKKSLKTRWLRGAAAPLFKKDHQDESSSHQCRTGTETTQPPRNPVASGAATNQASSFCRACSEVAFRVRRQASRHLSLPRFTPISSPPLTPTSRWTPSQPPAGARSRVASQSWASCRGCWGDAPGASTVVRDCSSNSNSNSSSNEWCIARRTIVPVIRRHRRCRWCRTRWNDDARTWARRRGREMRDVSPFDRSTFSLSPSNYLSLFLSHSLSLSLSLSRSLFLCLCPCLYPLWSFRVSRQRNTTQRTSHL